MYGIDVHPWLDDDTIQEVQKTFGQHPNVRTFPSVWGGVCFAHDLPTSFLQPNLYHVFAFCWAKHWVLTIMHNETKRVLQYNSMGSSVLEPIELLIKRYPDQLGNGWSGKEETCQQQDDTYSCGLFVLRNMFYWPNRQIQVPAGTIPRS